MKKLLDNPSEQPSTERIERNEEWDYVDKLVCEYVRTGRSDLALMNEILELMLPWVYLLAQRRWNTSSKRIDVEDMVQAAYDKKGGLRAALRNFKPESGFRFTTYAADWIKQSFTRGMSSNNAIDHPAHVLLHTARVMKAVEQLEQEQSAVTVEAIAAIADVKVENVEKIFSTSRVYSLDMPVASQEEEELTFFNVLPDPAPSALERMIEREETEALHALMQRVLTEREQQVIHARYFLDYSFKDAAAYVCQQSNLKSYSRFAVQLAERSALRKLYAAMQLQEKHADRRARRAIRMQQKKHIA